jgi:hypothetical protein
MENSYGDVKTCLRCQERGHVSVALCVTGGYSHSVCSFAQCVLISPYSS